jgi:hypothetical protein
MDSFYTVLPSNTPFPGNITSDYLVKLPNIIDLSDGNWSVALSSIVYPNSFSGIEEAQTVTIIYNDNTTSLIDIAQKLQYKSVQQFSKVLNDTIYDSIFKKAKNRPKRTTNQKPNLDQKLDLDQRPSTREQQDTRTQPSRPAVQPRQEKTNVQPRKEKPTVQPRKDKPDQSRQSTDQIVQRSETPNTTQSNIEQSKKPDLDQRFDQRPKAKEQQDGQTQPSRPAVQPRKESTDQRSETPNTTQSNIEQSKKPDLDQRFDQRPKAKEQQDSQTQPSRPAVQPRKESTDQRSETPNTTQTNIEQSKKPDLDQKLDLDQRFDQRPPPSDQKLDLDQKFDQTKPTSTKDGELHDASKKAVVERPSVQVRNDEDKKPKIMELSEIDRQALETAKRVALNLLDDIDKTFDKIEEYNITDHEIIKRVQKTGGVESGTAADRLKTNIVKQTTVLTTLRNAVLFERNKAREFKEKVNSDYTSRNVRAAKLTTDSMKRVKKIVMGDDTSNGYLQRIESIHNQLHDDSDAFYDSLEDASLAVEGVYDELIVMRDIIRNGYRQLLYYAKDIDDIMKELKTSPSDESNKLYYRAEKIIALKSSSNAEFNKLAPIVKEMDQFYIDKKLSGLQKKLIEIKQLNKALFGENGYQQTIKTLRDSIVQDYSKIRAPEPITETSREIADTWHESTDLRSKQRVFGQESQLEGHIAKSTPLQEKTYQDKPDEWNIIDHWTEESKQFDYRKDEIVSKIKTYFDNMEDIGGAKQIGRPEFQQIYFFYDEDQLQRFYMWVSDDKTHKKIKKVQLSKQLAYMLGFVQDNKGLVKINSFARYNPDVSGGIHSFYVYCPNLIANTIIGNKYGPLLRVINVDLESKNKVVETIYTQEFHHKVLLKQIPEIRIQILSDTSRPIEFNWGNCILTLHFRRALF